MHIICELEVQFKPEAEEDLEYFNKRNRQKLKKIALLLEDIKKHPFSGTGKPEALKHDYSGYWSRRIDKANRLIYKVEHNQIIVLSCRYHYTK